MDTNTPVAYARLLQSLTLLARRGVAARFQRAALTSRSRLPTSARWKRAATSLQSLTLLARQGDRRESVVRTRAHWPWAFVVAWRNRRAPGRSACDSPAPTRSYPE